MDEMKVKVHINKTLHNLFKKYHLTPSTNNWT